MADGNFEQKIADDGTVTYESETKNGALTITTTYDDDFAVTDTLVEKAYANIKTITEMSENFQRSWAAVKDNLPASFTATDQVVQFGEDRDNLVVIATVDVGDVKNGDVLGRINSWSNEGDEGTWQRWIDDSVVDVKNQEWSFNFHDNNWNRIAEYGEREIYLDLADGLVLDETGLRVTSFVHKEDTDAATWTEITQLISDAQLQAIDANASWDDVKYVEIQDNTWTAKENLYRGADDLWSDSEEQILVHGDDGNGDTVFMGSIAKRDGFIVVRDDTWNEVARLTDPDSAMSYADVKAIHGDAFDAAWDAIGDSLPDAFKDNGQTNEDNLKYNVDKWGNILVFDETGVMIGEIHNWGHTDTWERSWDDSYPYETYENTSFNFVSIETGENGDIWTDIGRYEVGKATLHTLADPNDADGTSKDDRSWDNVSSTVYQRKVSEDNWANLEAANLTDLVATTLEITWDSVDRLEISSNTHKHYPNEWRDTVETDVSESVRFFSEESMNDGDWYANQFLGGAEKRGGFIEIYGPNWNTLARVADSSSLLTWDEIKAAQAGLEQAWDDVGAFLPDAIDNPSEDGLKFSTDDNNIYAFTAAGVMAAQINYWSDTHTWDGWFDGKVLPVESVNYNYNFHDADWNNIANAGGFDRFIIEDDGTKVHDETGTNIGLQIYKNDVSDDVWQSYNPDDDTGTIEWAGITEIRYQTDTWKSIDNVHRHDDWAGTSSQNRVEFFEEVEDRGWSEFVGAVEKRDGYIEIRDKHWNLVAQKIDPDAQSLDTSYSAMVTKYGSEFTDAWAEVASSLPSVFKDEDGNTNEENFLYATDKWDNIIVFSADGTMIGEINYWSHADTWERTWDAEYTAETHENTNFNFSVIDVSGEGREVTDVARYEVGSNTLIKADGTKVVDRSWEQVSSTLMERNMTADDWAQAKTDYFLDNVTDLLGFTWDDVDKIEVGSRERTEFAVRWRTEKEESTEQRIEFISEVSMNDGDWYAHEFLGSVEYREGFIEIRDGDWNTVARIVDASSAVTFADISGDNPHLEWAWEQVKSSLPEIAQDYSTLTFTVGSEYDPIKAFDASGAMVLQIGSWDWSRTEPQYNGVTEEETGQGYDFQDEHWNRYAQADISERYVSDDNNERALDQTWTSVSSTIRKEDVTPEAWAKYNPNDTTGTINWDEIVEISVGVNEWETEENFNRDADRVYSGNEERIEYSIEVGDLWGTWTERVAITEREGNLMTVKDSNWEVVGQIVAGEAQGVPLTSILTDIEKEILDEYGEIIAKYLDVTEVDFIESTSGRSIIVQDGAILATMERYENLENDETELYYNYDIRDTQGNHILRIGGWNQLDDAGIPQAKPNGVEIGEFFYKDDTSPEVWAQLEADYAITWPDFDWSSVGILEKRIWRNDWNGNDTYEQRDEAKFIQIEPNGRENWDYFQAVYDGAMVTVKDSYGNTLGSYLNAGAGITEITDLSLFNSGFSQLVDDIGILDDKINGDTPPKFYLDDVTKNLLIATDGEVVAEVTDSQAEWGAKYDDTNQGYEFRAADGDYLGWHYESTPVTRTDAAGNVFENITIKSAQMRFKLGEDNDLSPDAIAFLNYVFAPNPSVDHEFYDLDAVHMRNEQWIGDDGAVVNESVLIQHNVKGEDGWSIRTGFDLTNSKAIQFIDGKMEDEKDEDGNVTYTARTVTETSLDMDAVKGGIDAFNQHAHYDADFPDDLDITNPVIDDLDTLAEITVQAQSLMDAEDALETAYKSTSLSETEVSGGTTLTYTVTDGATSHVGVLTSTQEGFGDAVDTYYGVNTDLTLLDFLDDFEEIVALSVKAAGIDMGGLEYTATYSYDDDVTDQTEAVEVLSIEISDAGKLWNYEVGGDDDDMSGPPGSGDHDDELPFLLDTSSQSHVNLYTPDDAMLIKLSDYDELATGLISDGIASDQAEAAEMAIEGFVMDFFGGEDEYGEGMYGEGEHGEGDEYGQTPIGGEGDEHGETPIGGEGDEHGETPIGGEGDEHGETPIGGEGDEHGETPIGGEGDEHGETPIGGEGDEHGETPIGGEGDEHGEEGSATVFNVTVDADDGSNKYFITTLEGAAPTLTLISGQTYKFDLSDSTNGPHPFKFSETGNGTNNGGTEYTEGVTYSDFAPGGPGAFIEISVTDATPELYYYCTEHSDMGGIIETPEPEPTTPTLPIVPVDGDVFVNPDGMEYVYHVLADENITLIPVVWNESDMQLEYVGSGAEEDMSASDAEDFLIDGDFELPIEEDYVPVPAEEVEALAAAVNAPEGELEEFTPVNGDVFGDGSTEYVYQVVGDPSDPTAQPTITLIPVAPNVNGILEYVGSGAEENMTVSDADDFLIDGSFTLPTDPGYAPLDPSDVEALAEAVNPPGEYDGEGPPPPMIDPGPEPFLIMDPPDELFFDEEISQPEIV